MNALVHIGLTNALAAAALAVIAGVGGKLCRRPALRHALWLLVMVKLVTPPLVVIPIAILEPPDEPVVPAVPQAMQQPAAEVCESAPIPEDPRREVLPPASEHGVAKPTPVANLVQAPEPFGTPVNPLKASSEPEMASETPAEVEPAFGWPDVPWLTLLAGGWFAGSLAWFAIALTRIRRFQLVLNASQAAPVALQSEASALAARMGLRDCPGVCLVPSVVSPLLWAVAGYPKLLLPAHLLGRLDPLQRRTLLAHELAHYRRRDHWVRCLEFLALGVYWWFPVVWWARRELREAEEECCDAWVLWTLPQAAKAYASALVETLDFLSNSQLALPPAASGLGQLDLLRRRLTMIMRGTMPRNLGGLGFLAVVGLGVLLLPLVPTWAQQDPTAPPGIVPTLPGQPSPTDLNKAKAELERATAELHQFKVQLEFMRLEFEKKARMLEEAEARLKDAMKKAEADANKGQGGFGGGGKGPGPGGKGGGFGGGYAPFGPVPPMEKRLAELEKKLDQVLDELQDMRKTMGKGFPGDDPFKGGGKKGGKGKGGFGSGGGFGGGGGGFPQGAKGGGGPKKPPSVQQPPVEDIDPIAAPAISARDPLPGETKQD